MSRALIEQCKKRNAAAAKMRKAANALGIKKPPKYKNTKVDGYDSLKEKRRADQLKLMQKAGVISELKEKPDAFELIPKQKGERAVSYLADFQYRDADGNIVVEDVKSAITAKNPAYIIKRKLMLHVHGIRIVQV